MNTKQLGVVTILLASIIWAIEPILAKLSYENSDVLQTSAIRAVPYSLSLQFSPSDPRMPVGAIQLT